MSDAQRSVRFTRGASYLITQSLGVNLVQIVAFVILARLISTREMGILAVLSLITATCQTFGTLSISSAVTKFVAENAARSETDMMAAAFYQALRFALLISLPVVALVYGAAPYLALHLLGDVSYAGIFRVLAVDVFIYAGANPLLTGALLGLHKFRETAIVGLIVGGLIRQSLIIGLIILTRNFVGLVYAWVLSDASAAVIYFVLVFRNLGRPRFDFSLARLLRFSIPLTFSNGAAYAQSWFDRVLLVVFVPLSVLGVYNATLTAFGVLQNISIAMSSMLFPAYSSLQSKEDGSNMGEAARLAIRYSTLLLIPLALGLLAASKPALTLFVGESYSNGTVPLMILSGVFAITVIGSTALPPVLLALGKTRLTATIMVVSVIISLAAAYVLLPTWGIVAASAARGLAMVISAVLTIYIVGKMIPLNLESRSILRTLFAGIVMAVVVYAVELVRYGKLLLPVYVAVGGVVYLVMLRVLRAVDIEDVELLRGLLGERFAPLCELFSWIVAPRPRR